MGMSGERSRILPETETPLADIQEPKKYRVYPARWLVLAVCCLLALSNATLWIGFTTLSEQTRIYYCDGGDCSAAFFTNQIFQLVAVMTGIGGMYITDNYGIRLSIMCGTTLNFVGSLIRVLSSVPNISNPETRQALLHSGSVIVASAQAFFLVLPSKIAEGWFPENQRAISNVLTFIANPAGVALGTLVPSLYFDESTLMADTDFNRNSWHMFKFNSNMAVLTALTFLLSLFIKRGNPPTPPSASNETHASDAPPFGAAINMCFRNKQFIIQMFTFALAFAELWGFMVIMPDILTERGYNLQGYPTALCALVGVLASLIAGAIADKKKNFKELIRVCWVFLTISILFTRIWLRKQWTSPSDSVVVMVACAAMGAFSIPQFPIGVEMGVETTFPVYEATASGILVLSGQLWMFILYGVFELTKRIDVIYDYDRKSSTGNWELVLDMWCTLAILSTIISFFMNPTYKRLQCEDNIKHQFQENGGENTEPSQFTNDVSRRHDSQDKDVESRIQMESRDYHCIGTKDL